MDRKSAVGNVLSHNCIEGYATFICSSVFICSELWHTSIQIQNVNIGRSNRGDNESWILKLLK